MALSDDPEIKAHWDRWEAAGLPSVFQLSDAGQFRTSRVPLLDDAVSYHHVRPSRGRPTR